MWTSPSVINQLLNNYGVYAAEVDGSGSYTISNLPFGKYLVVILSNNTKEERWFNDKTRYHSMVKELIQNCIGEQNMETFLVALGAKKMATQLITIQGSNAVICSYDFGITYF